METLKYWYEQAARKLNTSFKNSHNKTESANIEIIQIIKEILKISPHQILLSDNLPLKQHETTKLNQALEQKLNHKPLSKIFNSTFFYDMEFYINQDVLDPRLETEYLVTQTIKHIIGNHNHQNILELGVGSGAISISIQKHFKNKLNITSVDISSKALEVAKTNAERHNVSINLYKSNWFEIFNQNKTPNSQFDVIVSNPPYIKSSTFINPETKYDPSISLYAEQTGLKDYYEIISQAHQYLFKDQNSKIFLEIPANLIGDIAQIIKHRSEYKAIKGHKTSSKNIIILEITSN